MASKPKYSRPPILEAICEIHFKLPNSLDPAKIRPMWQTTYPNQEVVSERNFEFLISMDKADAKSTEVGQRLMTRSEDGRGLAQLGPRFMAINRLSPYAGWEESFRGTILSRLKEVKEAYSLEDVERIGLRYINKIDFPQK